MRISQIISKIFGLNLFWVVFLKGLLLVTATSFIACGDDKKADVTEFIIANGAEPEAIDPHLLSGVPETRIYQSMFEALFSYGPKAEIMNGLVSSYTSNDEGTIYQFTLRKDIVWSDGAPITTEDVLFSFRRILNPMLASPYAWFPELFIKNGTAYNKGEVSADELGVRIIDEQTFELELVGPLPYVVDALRHQSFAIIPKHVVEKYGEDWTLTQNIVTNGPFTLKEWIPQDKLVVEKNPLYWDADNVKLDEVVFLASEDGNTNYNAYINGEVDWLTSTPQGRLDEAKLRDDYYVHPSFSTYYYSVQFNKPELSDVRVREALARSINKEILVQEITRNGQIPTNAIVPPLPTYTPVDGYNYDVEKARKLFAEAGYPDGKGFPTLTILYNTSEGHKRIAEYVQQEWLENLGVKVTLENMEWKTFLKVRRAGDFQIARDGWLGDYLDPNTFLDMFVSGGASNGIQYANPEYDRLLKEASRTKDVTSRMGLLKRAESILIEQDIGIIPIYYYTSSNMFNNKKWEGFYNNIANRHSIKFIKPKKE